MSRSQEYTVVIEQDEDGNFVAEVPQLKSCYTQARTMDELMVRIREAIALSLEEEGPSPALHFIGVQRVAV